MSVIEFRLENKIGILTLNRPEALNALNSELMAALEAQLQELETMPAQTLRCLILTGAGEKAFVAGADIKEIHSLTPETAKAFAINGQKIFRRLEQLAVPVIAAVNGFALGGGLEFALSCDFIYAADNAKLGLPEVSLGLLPGFGGTVRLARVVGKARAKEMVLSGLPLTANEALSVGLVNKVLPPADLMGVVLKLAETLATRGPLALQEAKKSIDETLETEIDLGFAIEAAHFSQLFSSQDMREGTLAFIEKRKALFLGK